MNNKEPEKEAEVGTRQERREKKLKKRRERMPQHGQSLARVYINAVLKRLRLHKTKGNSQG